MLSKIWNFLVQWHQNIHAARQATSYAYRGDYCKARDVMRNIMTDNCTVSK